MPVLRRKKILGALFAAVLALSISWSGLAESWEEDLFGGGEDELFGGSSLFTVIDESESATSLQDELLIQDEVRFGGSFSLSLGSAWMWPNWEQFRKHPGEPMMDFLTTNLQAGLYMDARPDRSFRVFGKALLNYSGNDATATLSDTVKITELFADFNHRERLFFRVGKQNISWGVGYFMSPADIINLTPIDPTDPEAEREGRLALRLNAPVGINNLYLYVLADNAAHLRDIAWAPKVEVVVKGFEFGLGGYLKSQQDPLLMATVSGAVGDFSLFGEGAYKFSDMDSWQATAGFLYGYGDKADLFNFNLAAQYLYNGDADLVSSKWPGRHHLAAALLLPDVLHTDLSVSALLLSNLSDDTGMSEDHLPVMHETRLQSLKCFLVA
jgi:hypothetical protein